MLFIMLLVQRQLLSLIVEVWNPPHLPSSYVVDTSLEGSINLLPALAFRLYQTSLRILIGSGNLRAQ